jgi:hypothetical protein
MTTATLSPALPQASRSAELSRIWNVVRLHFVNTATTIIVPWIVLGSIFAINLMIWAIIYSAAAPEDRAKIADGTQWSGSIFYIFVYMLVVAVQAISTTFPFALGFSVTRRDYYLGTSLSFLLLSGGYAIALTALSLLEDATNGWGLHGRMFTAVYFGGDAWYERLFVFFVGLAFFFFVGSIFAAVWVRWKQYGLLGLTIALALLLVGAVALISFTNNWPAVGAWFVANGPVGVVAWMLVPTALSAVAGFFLLRRATPKN